MAKLKFNPAAYQDLGAYALLKNVVENQHLVAEDSRPYKVYSALLTQTGSDAPVATILENTIGTLTWAYVSAGIYTVTSPLLNDAKTLLFVQPTFSNSPNNVGYYLRFSDPNVLQLTTLVEGSGEADGFISNTTVEIRIYN